jgi:hypothetical protein
MVTNEVTLLGVLKKGLEGSLDQLCEHLIEDQVAKLREQITPIIKEAVQKIVVHQLESFHDMRSATPQVHVHLKMKDIPDGH